MKPENCSIGMMVDKSNATEGEEQILASTPYYKNTRRLPLKRIKTSGVGFCRFCPLKMFFKRRCLAV